MENSNNLSVIIITRNEEEALPSCLDSVKKIANEIILVDSGSSDKTKEIARRYTDKIFHRDWAGYSAQKQFALEKASGPWVLNIDADEHVSPELAEEILKILPSSPNVAAFDIPFKHFFCGTRLRFGGAQGETHIRLFKKGLAQYGTQTVHEGIQVDGLVLQLKNSILHYSTKDIHDYLTKCNDYTTVIARAKFQKGARFHLWHHLRLPYEVFVRLFVKLGILDGEKGFTYAILSSYYVWLKYIKLRDFERSGS